MRVKSLNHIFIAIIAAFIAVIVLCFTLPCEVNAATDESGGSASDGATLAERHIWFTYSYTDCTGEAHPASGNSISYTESTDSAYPVYFATVMMACDTDHVLQVEGDGVTDKQVTYTSLTPKVLDIDSSGNVTLLKTGTARVKATVAADKTYRECSIYLDVKVDRHTGWIEGTPHFVDRPESWGLEIDTSDGPHPLALLLRPGASAAYTAENQEILTVDQNGVVTPLMAGTTQIIMDIDSGGGKYKACRIGWTIIVSGDPVTYDPDDPQTGDPDDPQTGDPDDPQTGDPDDPQTDDPDDPQTGDPDDPQTSDPDDPQTGDPDVLIERPGLKLEYKCITCSGYGFASSNMFIPPHSKPEYWEFDMKLCDTEHVISVTGTGIKDNVTFESADPDILDIDSKGNVTLKKTGETIITVNVGADDTYKENTFVILVDVGLHDNATGESGQKADTTVRNYAVEKAAALRAEISLAKSLKKPTFKVKALKGRKNKLTWSKVANADGYIVYIKYPGRKKYVKAVTRNATVKSVTHRGLSKRRVYKYKVRAFKKVNGKVYYSPFSKVRKVRAR